MTRKDGLSGFYPRWNVTFNITMLRLVSFNVDYIWATESVEAKEVRLKSRPRSS